MKIIDKIKSFFKKAGNYIWKRTFLFLVLFLLINIVFAFVLFFRFYTPKADKLPAYSLQIKRGTAHQFSDKWSKREEIFNSISTKSYPDVFERKFPEVDEE